MKTISLRYGLIVGVILFLQILLVSAQIQWEELAARAAGSAAGALDFDIYTYIVGFLRYPIFIISLLLGVRALRNSKNPPIITFAEVFKCGAYISVIAALFVSLSHFVYYSVIEPKSLEIMYQLGVAGGQIVEGEMRWLYTLWVHPLIYFVETCCIGLLVSLFAGLFYRTKDPKIQAHPNAG